MSAENPYQAPESELIQKVEGHVGGSLAGALAGDYKFSIVELMLFGWHKTHGFKGVFWLATLVYVMVSGAVGQLGTWFSAIIGLKSGLEPGDSFTSGIPSMLLSLILGALVYSLAVGLFVLAINRAADRPVKPGDVFKYFPKTLPIFVTYLLMMLLTLLGFCLLILPGIYLSIAYLFALPLLVDKNLSPWEALEASRKAVHHQWLRVFGLVLMAGVLSLLSILLLGIPLIWLLPASAVAMGKLYIVMFGLEARVEA